MALATMALVIAAASLLGILRGVMVESQLENKVKALEASQGGADNGRVRLGQRVEALSDAVTLLSQQVDLTNPRLQYLRDGFAISELKVARQESGVLVAGRLINASSLGYRDVTFRVKAGPSSGEFTVDRLSAGSGGEFQVVLPKTSLENARLATFSLVASTVDLAH